MNNIIKTFTSPMGDSLRVFVRDGEPWFVGKEVATALGYKNTNKAINAHVDTSDKRGVPNRYPLGRTTGNNPHQRIGTLFTHPLIETATGTDIQTLGDERGTATDTQDRRLHPTQRRRRREDHTGKGSRHTPADTRTERRTHRTATAKGHLPRCSTRQHQLVRNKRTGEDDKPERSGDRSEATVPMDARQRLSRHRRRILQPANTTGNGTRTLRSQGIRLQRLQRPTRHPTLTQGDWQRTDLLHQLVRKRMTKTNNNGQQLIIQ